MFDMEGLRDLKDPQVMPLDDLYALGEARLHDVVGNRALGDADRRQPHLELAAAAVAVAARGHRALRNSFP